MRSHEGIAWRSVSIVRDDSKAFTKRIQREAAEVFILRERAVLFEHKRKGHRVETQIRHLESEVPLVACVECVDIVANVMANDHAVFQVVEELFERFRLVETCQAFVARHAVNCNRAGIVIDLQ